VCGPGYRSKLWGYAHILARLLIAAAAGGNLTTDGHLAMLAIEHGATLGSFDPDYERFSGLAFDAHVYAKPRRRPRCGGVAAARADTP